MKAVKVDIESVTHDDDVQKIVEDPDFIEEIEEDDDGLKKDVAQSSEEDKEKFIAAFNSKAEEGEILVEELPIILALAGIDASDDEIQAVFRRLLGDSVTKEDKVNLKKALPVFEAFTIKHESTVVVADEKELNCLARWADNASDKKATNVLLLIVVGVSFVSAALAAGLAILFMWNASIATLNNQILEDIGTMRDIIDVFDKNIYVNEINNRVQDLATVIASVTTDVSYKSVLEYNKKDLQYMAGFLASAVGAWWEYLPELAYTSIARVMALWFDAAMQKEGKALAINMTNEISALLPDGYEILVGQWTDATNTSTEFLTNFRFASQCAGVCGSNATVEAFSPMKAAMSGIDGAIHAFDYRPHEVLVGYSSISGVGVEYKSDIEVVQQSKYDRLREFFDAQNANALDSREFLLGRVDASGNRELLSKLRGCDSTCAKYAVRPLGPLGQALAGKTGTIEVIGYQGKPVISSFVPIPGTNMGLVVQMLKEEAIGNILKDAGRVADYINDNLAVGTEELELQWRENVNGTFRLTHLSKYRWPKECPSTGCINNTEYLTKAIANCSSGVVRTTDYRGKKVVAGYYCMPGMNAYISVKMDIDEVNDDMLKYIIQFINERNDQDAGTTDDFLVAKAKPGFTSATVTDFSQFELLTLVKDPSTCLTPDCHWNSKTLLRAIQNKPGDLPTTMSGVNYAGIAVTGALEFNPDVGGGIGMVMQKHTDAFLAPVIDTAVKVIIFTVAVTVSMLTGLVFLTKSMMRNMITASEEGKKAVQREKDQFQALVASMYPAYVVPRLLAGERHIVCHVKHTAVFFSDIYEFTSASNVITSEELIQFMGYTYGVMDDIAERYNVYKVKTVGDAYLAIAGLPGTETKECCLDMLRFASCVAQIFSHRFNHPDKGKILAVIGGAMSWNRKRKRAAIGSKTKSAEQKSTMSGNKASIAPPSAIDGQQSAWGKGGDGAESSHPQSAVSGTSRAKSLASTERGKGAPQVQCVMSYGVATGPVTAGVLQGKSPMFDIWGKTVNLASRMESTGQPGRIQVSEGFFKKVAAVPNQPFTFEPGHKAYCKGFGAVSSYFVASTTEPPPKALMVQLGLEPRFGLFYFDNILNGLQRGGPNGSAAPGAASGGAASHTEDSRSEASSRSSQKAHPQIRSPKGDGDILDYEDA